MESHETPSVSREGTKMQASPPLSAPSSTPPTYKSPSRRLPPLNVEESPRKENLTPNRQTISSNSPNKGVVFDTAPKVLRAAIPHPPRSNLKSILHKQKNEYESSNKKDLQSTQNMAALLDTVIYTAGKSFDQRLERLGQLISMQTQRSIFSKFPISMCGFVLCNRWSEVARQESDIAVQSMRLKAAEDLKTKLDTLTPSLRGAK